MAETQVTETSTTTTETTSTIPSQVETVEEQPEQEEHHSSLLTDILTIIGFAILFIIIIWGLVHLVELIGSSFSANKPAPTIQVNAPAQAISGQPVTISWNYAPSVAGSYAFLYECASGLTFDTKGATTTEMTIPCGVAYSNGATSSVAVTPVLSSASSTTDTISIVFIPQQGGSQVQGDATMVINPAAKPVTTTPAKTTTKSTSYSSGSNYNYSSGYTSTSYAGPAQLAVSIISGNIDGNGDGTVTFNIANVGGSTSGSYYFSAQLPTAEPYPYQSPLQAPLAPGAHVVSTLNFTDAASGGGLFSVSVEGGSANTSSDYASQDITGPYSYNNGSTYGYDYQQPYVQTPTYTY